MANSSKIIWETIDSVGGNYEHFESRNDAIQELLQASNAEWVNHPGSIWEVVEWAHGGDVRMKVRFNNPSGMPIYLDIKMYKRQLQLNNH